MGASYSMSSNVQTLPQEMEKCDKFKKWTAVFWTCKTKDHQYSTSCSHKDFSIGLSEVNPKN